MHFCPLELLFSRKIFINHHQFYANRKVMANVYIVSVQSHDSSSLEGVTALYISFISRYFSFKYKYLKICHSLNGELSNMRETEREMQF